MELTPVEHRAGGPARWLGLARTVTRLAARQARGHRGATLLVLALIAVPMAAATVGLCLLRSLNPTAGEQARMEFGDAELRMYGALGRAADTLPAGSRVGELSRTVQQVRAGMPAAGGPTGPGRPAGPPASSPVVIPVVATRGDHGLVRSRSALDSGRWPAGPADAAVTAAAAEALGVGLGQTISIGGRDHQVVGVYRTLRNRQAREIQTQPADLAAPVSETLVDLPDGADADQVAARLRAAAGPVATRTDAWPDDTPTPAVVTQWSVILIEVALLVGAVFAVTREREARQARALELLGATRGRLVAIAGVRALALGVVGAAVGMAAGILTAEIIRRAMLDTVRFAAPSVRVPAPALLFLAGFVLLTTSAAAMAALRPPGRGAHAADIRPAGGAGAVRGAPDIRGVRSVRGVRGVRGAWRSTVAATALAAAGVGCLAAAARLDGGVPRALLLSAGGAAVVIAAALLGAELLFLAARVRSGPPALRIGLRDLARHRARTRGLMVAAVAGLAGGTMAISALSSLAARDRQQYQPQLAADQVILDTATPAQARALADMLGAEVAPIAGAQRAARPAGPAPADGATSLVLVARPDGGQDAAAVAAPAELPAYGIPREQVRGDGAGQAFVLLDGAAAGDTVRLAGPDWSRELPAHRVGPLLRADSPLPAVVITHAAARELGLAAGAEPSSWVLRTARPLTADEHAALGAFTARHPGVSVVTEQGWTDPDATFRRWLNAGVVGFGALTCLLTVVLAETERARTYGILHTLGCSPRLRRSLAATSAAVLSLWFAALAGAVALPLTAVALGETDLVVDRRTLLASGALVVVISVLGSLRARTRTSAVEGVVEGSQG